MSTVLMFALLYALIVATPHPDIEVLSKALTVALPPATQMPEL